MNNYKIENLNNINNTRNIKLPKREKILDYINQIKNPFCYEDEGRKVILNFKDDFDENIKDEIFIKKYIKQYLKL